MIEGSLDRIDVTSWPVVSVEKRGSTRNLWLQDPESSATIWLHKDTLVPENGEEQGEDRSEILSTMAAVQLGVPCAPTLLCTREGRRGSLSSNIRPPDADLHEGGIALEQRSEVIDYFPHREGAPGVDPARPAVKRPGHTVANIKRALEDVGPPPGFHGPSSLGGFDVFTGYLLLDALIANRDRHEQNWAVLVPPLTSQQVRLAPTYDHASSLGYNLRDEQRRRCLTDAPTLARWARNGTAYRFEHEKKAPTLVQLAIDALALCSEDGRGYWSDRLAQLDLEPVHSALRHHQIEAMSEVACKFVGTLLEHNLGRLRDAISSTD